MSKKSPLLYAFCLSLTGIFLHTPAYAIDKIYSPKIEKGELEIEYLGNGKFDRTDGKEQSTEHALELEYGVTDRFFD